MNNINFILPMLLLMFLGIFTSCQDASFTYKTSDTLDQKYFGELVFRIEWGREDNLLFLNQYKEDSILLHSSRIINYEGAKIDSIYYNTVILKYNTLPLNTKENILYDTLANRNDYPDHFLYNGDFLIIYKYVKRDL